MIHHARWSFRVKARRYNVFSGRREQIELWFNTRDPHWVLLVYAGTQLVSLDRELLTSALRATTPVNAAACVRFRRNPYRRWPHLFIEAADLQWNARTRQHQIRERYEFALGFWAMLKLWRFVRHINRLHRQHPPTEPGTDYVDVTLNGLRQEFRRYIERGGRF